MTALPAIRPWPCQPRAAPLHAHQDDSGDTVQRSSTPQLGPTDDPWPWLVGKPDAGQMSEHRETMASGQAQRRQEE